MTSLSSWRLYAVSVGGITGGLLYAPAARRWLLVNGIGKDASNFWAGLTGVLVALAIWWVLYEVSQRLLKTMAEPPVKSEKEMAQALKRAQAEGKVQRAELDMKAVAMMARSDDEICCYKHGTEEHREWRRRHALSDGYSLVERAIAAGALKSAIPHFEALEVPDVDYSNTLDDDSDESEEE
jgi:hypothetical protein